MRIVGLDSIRFAAACIVAISHGLIIPPQVYWTGDNGLEFWSGQIGHMLASGTGAVALFFVVSGLCIHLGRETAERDPRLFLVRRMIRVGVPMLAMLVITSFEANVASVLERGIFWSVYCEIGYYLTYPLLLAVLRRWSLRQVLSVSVTVSALLLAVLPGQELVWEYGYWTALICYPLWIVGAMIAETAQSIEPRRSKYLWLWRFGLLGAAGTCSLIRHLPWAGDLSVMTYVVIGLLATPFLRQEIANAMAVPPSALTEKLGAASYSMYLTHRYPLYLSEQVLASFPQWFVASVELGLVAICCFAFYTLCERPALNLARSVALRHSFLVARQTRSS